MWKCVTVVPALGDPRRERVRPRYQCPDTCQR